MKTYNMIKVAIGIALVLIMGMAYLLNVGRPLKDVQLTCSQYEQEFRNRTLGVTFTIPDGWKNQLDSFDRWQDKDVVSFVEAGNEAKGEYICIFAYKLNFFNAFMSSNMWIDKFKKDFREGAMAQYHLVIEQDTMPVTFGNKKGSMVTFTGDMNGGPIGASMYSFKTEGYIVCVGTLGVPDMMEELDQIARTVKFEK